MQKIFPHSLCRAVTLTELLVVVVIVSLLATIAVPVYVNKTEQAKIATAKQEVRMLAEAEEACAAIHRFYVPLQVLDDIHGESPNRDTNPRTDDLFNEDNAGPVYLIYATRDLDIQRSDQAELGDRGLTNSHSLAVRKLYEEWAGPFLNPKRVAFQEEIDSGQLSRASEAVHFDFPLDPWGSPYRFFSPIGPLDDHLINEYAGGTGYSVWNTFREGRLPLTIASDNRFDRFAILSLGPNSSTIDMPNYDSGDETDDIYYLFGANFTESSFRAFY